MRKCRRSPLLACALASAIASHALAATWTNATSAGAWSKPANWASGIIPSGIDATADFSTLNLLADNTVHLDASFTVGTLLFGDTTPSNNWILDNNANATNTLSLTVSAGSPVVNVVNQSATIAAIIAGSQGFNKTGAGKLILSAPDTFTGISNVSAGTLVVANASALGAGGSSTNLTFVGAGSTLDLNGQNIGNEFLNLSGAGSGAGALINSSATPATASGTVNPTFAGNFFVGGTGTISLNGGVSNAAGNSMLNKIGNNTLFLAGNADNTGLAVNVSAGMLFLGKTSSASVHAIGAGGLSISGGAVTYASSGSDQIADAANVSISAGQLDLNGFSDTINTLSIQGTGINSAGALQNSAVSLTSALTAGKIQLTGDTTLGIPQSTGVLILQAPLFGTANLTKTGAGLLDLSANNTNFSGTLNINAGTVYLGADNALSNIPINISNNATLQLNGHNLTAGPMNAASGLITNSGSSAANLTIDNATDCTLNANITDGGTSTSSIALTKTGNGNLSLGGNNTFIGGFAIQAGTLKITSSQALGAPTTQTGKSIFISSSSTLDLNGQSITGYTLDLDGGSFIANSSPSPASIDGTITTNSFTRIIGPGDVNIFAQFVDFALLFDNDPGAVAITGTSTNSLSLAQQAGTLYLGKPSSPSVFAVLNLTIAGGITQLIGLGGNQIADSADVIIGSGGTLDTDGQNETVHSITLAGPGFNQAGALLNSAPTNSVLSANAITLMADTSISVSQPAASLFLNAPIFGNFNLTKIGAGTLILNGISTVGTIVINAGTVIQNTDITGNVINNANFTYNAGAFNARLINNGTLTLNANFTAANGLENDTTITLSPGRTVTLNGQGLLNAGTLNLAGGTLLLSTSGAAQNLNTGTINLTAPFSLNGATLTNDGAFILNGINVTGPGQFINDSAGVLSGAGVFSTPLTNNGTITTTANLNIPAPFTNNGLIILSGDAALLSGGTITNANAIRGTGKISSPIINNATVEPTGAGGGSGGLLTLAGTFINNNTLRIATGDELFLLGPVFPANNALISLAGGTLDTGNQPFTNNAQITGFGVLSTGTGGFTNNGNTTFTGGPTTINGDVTNNANKTINIKFQPAVFTGNITNNGTIKTTSTTVTFTGNYTGNTYISDPATNIFEANASTLPGGSMTGGPGDQFLFNTFTNNGTFQNGGNLSVSTSITNTATFTQSGPQTWSPGATFTNTSGLATFQSNAKLYGLTITAGTVDITTSKFIIETTNANKSATLATLLQNLATHSLTSSTMPSNFALALLDNAILNLTTFGGESADANSLLLSPELLGDANIDGHVDLTDLSTILNNFGASTPNWTSGNFDHATTIDLTDLSDVLNNFGATNPTPTSSSLATPTPEPAPLALLAPAFLLLSPRRKIRMIPHRR